LGVNHAQPAHGLPFDDRTGGSLPLDGGCQLSATQPMSSDGVIGGAHYGHTVSASQPMSGDGVSRGVCYEQTGRGGSGGGGGGGGESTVHQRQRRRRARTLALTPLSAAVYGMFDAHALAARLHASPYLRLMCGDTQAPPRSDPCTLAPKAQSPKSLTRNQNP
jgi:hypothetical protein